ncbi:serine palmitoyltransferase, long chain base subunit, partial [Perkinsus olseni]
EDALVMGMGFATNSTFLGALAMTECGSLAKRTLFVSDQLNHKSIVEGVKQSSAKVIGFKHNNMHDLEKILDRETRSGKWAKIVILVEGIYSMEGEFCRLRETVSLKNKYRCYLWLDEAHSIGAVGPTGRGVSELFDVGNNLSSTIAVSHYLQDISRCRSIEVRSRPLSNLISTRWLLHLCRFFVGPAV